MCLNSIVSIKLRSLKIDVYQNFQRKYHSLDLCESSIPKMKEAHFYNRQDC
jgi:hypothetical protein